MASRPFRTSKLLIIRHRRHDLAGHVMTLVDGAEIDIRIFNGELIVEHDPFRNGPKLATGLPDLKAAFS